MSVMTGNDEIKDLMAEIQRVAPAKKHSLSKDMVDGSRVLSLPAARQVLSHLGRCQDLERPAALTPAERDRSAGASRTAHRTLPVLGDFRDVPAGYYATRSETGSNDLDFWRVDRPKTGKWKDWSFAVRILGGGSGDDMRTVKLGNVQQRQALMAIRETGFDQAGDLFADAISRCKKCGLVLTDDASREARMGPTCRSKSN